MSISVVAFVKWQKVSFVATLCNFTLYCFTTNEFLIRRRFFKKKFSYFFFSKKKGKSQAIDTKRHMEFIAGFCRTHWWQFLKLWCRRSLASADWWFCWMVSNELLSTAKNLNKQYNLPSSHVLWLVHIEIVNSLVCFIFFFFFSSFFRFATIIHFSFDIILIKKTNKTIEKKFLSFFTLKFIVLLK